MTKFELLQKKTAEITKFSAALSVLSYDQQVAMPPSGAEYRGELMETLSVHTAKMMQQKSYLKLLDEVNSDPSLSIDERIIVTDIADSVKFSNRIPVKLHGKLAKIGSQCQAEWENVKAKKSDKKYLKLLEKHVDLIKESINYANQGEFATSYDYLLDDYCHGITSSEIDTMFSILKPFIDHKLLNAKTAVDPAFDAVESHVLDFSQNIASSIIGDTSSFRLSKSTHPFCETLGLNDVRITTRMKPGNILDTIGSAVHESGHATYELGLDKANYENALGTAASIAAHEGISLFYEKHIGESETISHMIANEFNYNYVAVRTWMLSVNPANPIRTESDEITYQRHIMNRYKIESELFNGNLKVSDIPARWNELYGKDLTPEIGYAVDVHWSAGLFGYFPSYSIGHMIAAQLRAHMPEEFFNGETIPFSDIRSWLKSHYFSHGARFGTSRLVKEATGKNLDPKYWMTYIERKFG